MNKIKNLIREDKVAQAIDELLLKYNDEESILLAAQYKKLAQDIRIGVLSPIDGTLERNKLRKSILEKAGEISQVQAHQSSQKKTYFLYIFSVLIILLFIYFINSKNQVDTDIHTNDSECSVQQVHQEVEHSYSPTDSIQKEKDKKEDINTPIINNFTNNKGVINIDQ